MKRLSLLTAIAALSMAGAAQAASSDSANVSLTATVASTCDIDDAGFSSATLDFGTQISSTTALLTPAALGPTTVTAMCNDASTTLDVTSANGGLAHNGTPPTIAAGSFAPTTLPYATTGGSWAGVNWTSQFDSDGIAATELTTTAINGAISFSVLLDSQTNPVLVGTYVDTLTVTVTTSP